MIIKHLSSRQGGARNCSATDCSATQISGARGHSASRHRRELGEDPIAEMHLISSRRHFPWCAVVCKTLEGASGQTARQITWAPRAALLLLVLLPLEPERPELPSPDSRTCWLTPGYGGSTRPYCSRMAGGTNRPPR